MSILLDILGWLLLLFGLYIVICSYIRQIRNFRNRNNPEFSASSPAPFIGPLFILVGMNRLPIEYSAWWWLIFLFDPDTIVVVLGLPVLFRSFFNKT